MELVEIAHAIAGVDVTGADRVVVSERLRLISVLRRLADSEELACNRRLVELAVEDPSISPEHVNADATQRRLRRAAEAVKSATRADACPWFTAALARGEISLGHLDAFLRGMRSLKTALRPRLSELEPSLVRIAARLSVEDFADRVRAEVRDLDGDDGRDRLAHQKRCRRAKAWTDRDGMWNLHTAFDPETGIVLDEIIRTVTEQLFRDGVTDPDAPDDPQLRQDWLRAEAVRRLLTGDVRVGEGEATIVVVIDEHTFRTGQRHACTRFEYQGHGDLPIETLLKYRGRAKFVPALVDRDGNLKALGRTTPSPTPEELLESLRHPVTLKRGRSRRVADANQHLATQVMYRTCAIPGCRVPSARCELHHLQYWEHGGLTDIDNLLPLCAHHHDRVHANSWTLELGPDRSLTIRRHGTILMTTGPPRHHWAA